VASEAELGEVFRLGEAAGQADIVREVGDQLAAQWLEVSRFREVQALTSRSLRVQLSPGTLLCAGLAQEKTGNLTAALGYYEQALPIYREVGDRAGEANTLNNIGMVHHDRGEGQTALGLYEEALPILQEVGDRAVEAAVLNNFGLVHHDRGDFQAALDYFEQALPIYREVEDRAGEAVVRSNIAMVHRGAGHLVEAIAELELVVALDEALQHADLEADTAMLEQVRAELDQRG
jgi:tetratricopeptide (TPR) repeat protein